MEISQVVPEKLRSQEWGDETVLVLGGPYIGKSTLFRNLDDIKCVVSLRKALTAPSHQYVVVDEFYRAYQAADSETRTQFVAWIKNREGTCLSARPRAFDWLLESSSTLITDELLNSFDSVYHICYRPSDTDDCNRTVERCLQIGGKGGDGLERAAVDDLVDQGILLHEYEFDNEILRKISEEEKYGPTLVPGLVAYLSEHFDDIDEAFVSESIVTTARELGEEFLENLALSELIKSTDETALFSWNTLASVGDLLPSWERTKERLGSAGDSDLPTERATDLAAPEVVTGMLPFLGPAAASGGALAMWITMRQDGDTDTEDAFDALLGEELTPIAQAELEQKLDLPPRTIENFRRLTRGETIENLLQFREQTETELEELQTQIDTVYSAIQNNEPELARLETVVETLESNGVSAETWAGLVSTVISESTRDIDAIAKSIEAEETTLLGTESIDPAEIPFSSVDESKDERTQLLEAISGGGIVILEGAHGTGKTTAAYQTLYELSRRGYDIKLPNFEQTRTRRFIEHGLTATESATITFNSFRVGTATVDGWREVQALLDWLDDGVCHAVVIECRSESVTQLNSLFRTKTTKEDVKTLWDRRTVVEFDRFDVDGESVPDHLRQMCDWTLDELGHEGPREELIDSAIRFAEGNPEITKVALRSATVEDRSLSNFRTPDELLWRDIDNIVADEHDVSELFERLCAVREATTGQLRALVNVNLASQARHLRGYLGTDVREKVQDSPGDPILRDDNIWEVSPDIYAGTVFRKEGLEAGRLGTYISEIDAEEQTELFTKLATNLVIAREFGRTWGSSTLIETTDVWADEFVDYLPPSNCTDREFRECIETLAYAGIPLDPSTVGQHLKSIYRGAETRTDELERNSKTDELVAPWELVTEYLAHIYVGHLIGDTGESAALIAKIEAADDFLRENTETDVGSVLVNTYSIAIRRIALAVPTLETPSVETWLDELIRNAQGSATTDLHDLETWDFLAKVYATAIQFVLEDHGRGGPNLDGWINELVERTQETVRSTEIEEEGRFVCEVAISLYEMGEFERAKDCFEMALDLDPNVSETHNSYANLLRRTGQTLDAEMHYMQAIKKEPDAIQARLNYGAFLLEDEERPGEAEEQFREAVARASDSADAHAMLGVALMAQESPLDEDAMAQLQQSLEYDENSLVGHIHLAQLYAQQNELQKADKHFRRAVESPRRRGYIYQEQDIARSLYARFLHEHGRLTEAHEQLLSSIRQNLEDGDVARARSKILFGLELAKDLGRGDQASELMGVLKRLVESDPRLDDGDFTREVDMKYGLLSTRLSDDEVEEFYERALQMVTERESGTAIEMFGIVWNHRKNRQDTPVGQCIGSAGMFLATILGKLDEYSSSTPKQEGESMDRRERLREHADSELDPETIASELTERRYPVSPRTAELVSSSNELQIGQSDLDVADEGIFTSLEERATDAIVKWLDSEFESIADEVEDSYTRGVFGVMHAFQQDQPLIRATEPLERIWTKNGVLSPDDEMYSRVVSAGILLAAIHEIYGTHEAHEYATGIRDVPSNQLDELSGAIKSLRSRVLGKPPEMTSNDLQESIEPPDRDEIADDSALREHRDEIEPTVCMLLMELMTDGSRE